MQYFNSFRVQYYNKITFHHSIKFVVHQSSLKFIMTRFSRRKRILFTLSGNNKALLSSNTIPAYENSLSTLVDVGGGVRYRLTTSMRAFFTLHPLLESEYFFQYLCHIQIEKEIHRDKQKDRHLKTEGDKYKEKKRVLTHRKIETNPIRDKEK